MYEYLNDLDFLVALDKSNIRTHYAKIILLTYDEQPVCEIQGNVTAGNLNIDGSSAVRRTISLTLLADKENQNIADIDNQISINKKVKILIGYKNRLKGYEHYGEIIWFKCGTFILTSANISQTTSSYAISISGKDKMCQLDGTAGGTLPASVTFSESYVYSDDGSISIEYPIISQIIYEAVNHWGGQDSDKIIISDLEDTARLLVRYTGDKPVYFNEDYSSLDFTPSEDFTQMVGYGTDIGYKETPFTYPGELTLEPGDTVVTLLDKIVEVLGNFEYFFDVDGNFIFQEIKNYLNTGSPLTELTEEDYTRSYNNAKFLYSLTDVDTTTAITYNPDYSNIKNDFYVYGVRETASGAEVNIKYHLAIDAKPDLDLATKYMWGVIDSSTSLIIRYEFNDISEGFEVTGYQTKLISVPCREWREELYRQAMNAQITNGVYDNYYDSELIAEWRGLFDPMKESWEEYDGWNPDIFNNPGVLNYWLDFIDTGSEMGKYSINQIGRRTIVVSNADITSIYTLEVPDIIFIESYDEDLISKYSTMGQKYFILTDKYYDLFTASSTGTSCFDRIRELLYQNLNYNATVSITCLPKYYMEPNNIIFIEDKRTGISGNYQITQLSMPLSYNGTMSITATEVVARI